ncbi:MAG: hypothetical protein LIO77_01465 [Rikenellaceae bacterium]|nr:hypothetical protein [Rikenellaceae bacterium]
MRTLYFILILTSIYPAYSQQIKNGIILPENSYPPSYENITYMNYNLLESDIEKAENIVLQNKNQIEKHPNYLAGNKKGVFGNFKKYYRQYYGFLNKENEPMILINYVLGKNKKIKNKETYIDVMDGGNSYWRVIINLETGYLVDFYINGEA